MPSRVERPPSHPPNPPSQGRHPRLPAVWVWVAALPQRLPQVSHDLVGFVAQLPPGDAHRPPALGDEDPVALAVGLEARLRCRGRRGRRARRPAALAPRGSRARRSARAARGRRSSAAAAGRSVEQRQERLLELVPRDPDRLRRLQQRPQLPRAPAPRMPLQQHRQRDPVPSAPALPPRGTPAPAPASAAPPRGRRSSGTARSPESRRLGQPLVVSHRRPRWAMIPVRRTTRPGGLVTSTHSAPGEAVAKAAPPSGG